MKKYPLFYCGVSLCCGALTVACAQRSPETVPSEAPTSRALADDAAPATEATEEAKATPAPAQAPLAPSEKDEAPGAAKRKATAAEETSSLSVEVGAFDDSLAPERLSCEGARPHRDAICSIAERLCELPAERPSTTRPSASCDQARQSCDAAKDKFKARCG